MNAAVADGGGGSAGITTTGAGFLHVGGANTFNGPVSIVAGTCVVENNKALGTTIGSTSVASGAVLSFDAATDLTIGNETLNLSGACHVTRATTWSGPIVLSGAANTFDGESTQFGPVKFNHPGIMSGTGTLTKSGDSGLVLSGASSNTYSGGTHLVSGEIELGKTLATAIPGNIQIDGGKLTMAAHNQIADSAAVTMNGGLLDLSAYQDAIGSLSGTAGEVQISFGTLTVSSGNFSGLLSGIGGNCFVKTGPSILTLGNASNGGNTLIGTILVNQGSLIMNGIEAGPVTVTMGGLLQGNGTILGAVNVAGGKLGLGTLKTGDLTVNGGGSHVYATIKSGGYTHAAVTGFVNLTGSVLDVTLAANPYIGTSYTLIDNDGADPITGTFLGLPEGATFPLNSQTFAISYVGGTGNDVVMSLVDGGAPLPVISTFTVTPVPGSMPAQFSIHLDGTGQPDTDHRIQTSTDLIFWENIDGTLTSDAQGHFSTQFDDLSATKRFYRLAAP